MYIKATLTLLGKLSLPHVCIIDFRALNVISTRINIT